MVCRNWLGCSSCSGDLFVCCRNFPLYDERVRISLRVVQIGAWLEVSSSLCSLPLINPLDGSMHLSEELSSDAGLLFSYR